MGCYLGGIWSSSDVGVPPTVIPTQAALPLVLNHTFMLQMIGYIFVYEKPGGTDFLLVYRFLSGKECECKTANVG